MRLLDVSVFALHLHLQASAPLAPSLGKHSPYHHHFVVVGQLVWLFVRLLP